MKNSDYFQFLERHREARCLVHGGSLERGRAKYSNPNIWPPKSLLFLLHEYKPTQSKWTQGFPICLAFLWAAIGGSREDTGKAHLSDQRPVRPWACDAPTPRQLSHNHPSPNLAPLNNDLFLMILWVDWAQLGYFSAPRGAAGDICAALFS